MLASRVRMGVVRNNGFPDSKGFLYNYGEHSEQWFVGYRETSKIVLTEYGEYLSIKNTGDYGDKTGAWSTVQKVDLTNKSTLKAYMEVIKASGVTDFTGTVTIGTEPDTRHDAEDKVAISSVHAVGLTTLTMDVSSLIGEYYISVHLYAGSFPATHVGELKLMQMWLDKKRFLYTFTGTNRADIKHLVPPLDNMFNNENFIFECEVNHTNASGIRTIYSDTSNDQFTYNRIGIQNSKLVIQFINQGGNELTLTSSNTVSANMWTKIKVVRNGFNFNLYVNDTLGASGVWNKGNWSFAPIPSNSATTCNLGVTYFGWNFMNPFIGELKNVKINGIEIV